MIYIDISNPLKINLAHILEPIYRDLFKLKQHLLKFGRTSFLECTNMTYLDYLESIQLEDLSIRFNQLKDNIKIKKKQLIRDKKKIINSAEYIESLYEIDNYTYEIDNYTYKSDRGIYESDNDIYLDEIQLLLEYEKEKDEHEFNKYYKKLNKKIKFNRLSDIDKILTIFNYKTQLFSKIKYLLFQYEGGDTIKNKKYLNNNILIIKPCDIISSIFYATSTTKWCTAAKENNLFNRYYNGRNKNIYILVDLNKGDLVYQLSNEGERDNIGEVKDAHDITCKLFDIYLKYPFLFRKISHNIIDRFEFIYDDNKNIYFQILNNRINNDNISKLLLNDKNDKVMIINNIILYDHQNIINLTVDHLKYFGQDYIKTFLQDSLQNNRINIINLIIGNYQCSFFKYKKLLYDIINLNNITIFKLFIDNLKKNPSESLDNYIDNHNNFDNIYFLPIEFNNLEMMSLLLSFHIREEIFFNWKNELTILETIINLGDNVDLIKLLIQVKLESYKDTYLELQLLFNFAIKKNRIKISEYLLILSEDLIKDNKDNTFIEYIELNDELLIHMFNEKSNIKLNIKTIKFLLDTYFKLQIPFNLINILHFGIITNNIELIEYLLTKDIDFNHINDDGDTFIMIAIKKQHVEIIELLLTGDINLDIIDNDGNTALMIAIQNIYIDKYFEIIKLLLTKDINLNLQDSNGNTILLHAILNNNIELIKLLLPKKINIMIENEDRKNAFYYAKDSKEILKLLHEKIEHDILNFGL